MKLYYNPRCSKSREALNLLQDKNIEIIEYLKDVPSIEELKEICSKCNIKPIELIRTKEEIYKELVNINGTPNDDVALKWMHDNPKIIERPILITSNKGVIGRPPERVLELI